MDRGPTTASYPADRAAALAGIPRSTLHYWARTELVVPSVSPAKLKRWSYADLLLLRLVDWLRHDKPEEAIPRASIHRIRSELAKMEHLGELLLEGGAEVWVDRKGRLFFSDAIGLSLPLGDGFSQALVDTKVNLAQAYRSTWDLIGPDLVRPRPTLRIIPGKLSGEPHVLDTRIQTVTLRALAARELAASAILELYPELDEESVAQAVDLERQLEGNLHGHGQAA